MVDDYAHRYSRVLARRQSVRRPQREEPPWLSRWLGTVMVALVLAGAGFSVWLNQRIETGLAELAAATARQERLRVERRLLTEERDRLQAEETVLARAAAMGLHPPAPGQILRP